MRQLYEHIDKCQWMGEHGRVATSLPLIQPDALAACCSPMTGGVVSDEAAETLARMFKALGDPTRVKLLSLIAAAPDGEACICDMTEPVGLSQPTVSHHMKLLVEAGIATREKRGKWAYYRVDPTVLGSLAIALEPIAR
jgi:ArsR family transcriptional regulator, arsenate/arsenite/antimonite-responsive transcriptional repressor